MAEPTNRTLGQRLLAVQQRYELDNREVCGLFINRVRLDAIPTEIESLPDAFRDVLKSYLTALDIGGPEWEGSFFVHQVPYIPNQTTEEFMALLAGVSRKNRETAEALWQYFQARGAR